MQKTLRKPENWQDFESLSKKLWGELWEIPFKIKKNGRLGQPQKGVDVYGIPKNETEYWGIQCKGKSDYLKSKLTKKEIDEEIEKAKSFSPKLKVFLIATTQNKDVEIEQYVREKDIENRNLGSFEIILFCWEDIVDLIEDNRETINWYLGINKFREKFDVAITFSDDEIKSLVKPKFLKSITKYKSINPNIYNPPNFRIVPPKILIPFESSEINRSWCSIDIKIKNIGNVVLEDWYLKLKLNKSLKISDGFSVNIWLNSETKKMMYDNRTLYGYKESNEFLYEPAHKEPLIQKSSRTFTIHFIPEFDQQELLIEYELFARDFDKTGVLEIDLQPEYKEEINYVSLNDDEQEKADKIVVKELIEDKK